MRKLKHIFTAMAVALCMVFAVGCYRIDAQKMDKVKGTYKLTTYTRTDGDTDVVTNYITDRGFETYLVVTGTGKGYFAHKDNDMAAYATEVLLTYEYDEEKTSHVSYVSYQDSVNSSRLPHTNFGVAKDVLNYSRPVLKTHSTWLNNLDGFTLRWEKVSKDTDLSYVREKLSGMKEYTYEGYAANAIYSINSYSSADNTTVLPEAEFPYQYYFIEMDASTMKATSYYALKTDLAPQTKTEDIVLVDSEQPWQIIQIGETVWTKGDWTYSYSRTVTVGEGENAVTHTEHMNIVEKTWTADTIATLIANKMPAQE